MPAKQYRVTILGAAAVGKSSLTSQFLSSDHMNTYDTVGKWTLIFYGTVGNQIRVVAFQPAHLANAAKHFLYLS